MSTAARHKGLRVYTLMLLLGAIVAASMAPLANVPGQVAGLVALLPCVIWVVVHSRIVRGGRTTARFLCIAAGIVLVIEILALAVSANFHAPAAPSMLGLPLHVMVAWVIYLYAGMAVTAALIQPGPTWWGAIPFSGVAAIATTALDLIADPVGVGLGSFVYRRGGPFMREIVGANHAHGIPLLNYGTWLVVAASAYVVFWLGTRTTVEPPVRGRLEALLFYTTAFVAPAIMSVRLGHPELLVIGGVPVALIASLVAHRLIADRRARTLTIRRRSERARVASLAQRRSANHLR